MKATNDKERDENQIQDVIKPPSNYSIQKPLQFTTKESNFSPIKKPGSEGLNLSKFRKENQNQIKPEKNNSSQIPKQSNPINSKSM